ncbi:hypothetical protein [Methylocystis sp. S23]
MIEHIFALIGALCIARKTIVAYCLMFGDRSGNSGRFGHWTGKKYCG